MGIGELTGVFLVLAAISGCPHCSDPDDRVRAARDHERQGRDEEVLRVSAQLIGVPDGHEIAGDVRQMMARVYLKRHRFCLARLFYEEALALHRTTSDHAGAYTDAIGTAVLVMLILAGLGYVETYIARRATHSHLLVHAKADVGTVEELETLLRRSGLTVSRVESRRENVDLVCEFDLRGPKRLHDQAKLAMLHHPLVRTVSTGE